MIDIAKAFATLFDIFICFLGEWGFLLVFVFFFVFLKNKKPGSILVICFLLLPGCAAVQQVGVRQHQNEVAKACVVIQAEFPNLRGWEEIEAEKVACEEEHHVECEVMFHVQFYCWSGHAQELTEAFNLCYQEVDDFRATACTRRDCKESNCLRATPVERKEE